MGRVIDDFLLGSDVLGMCCLATPKVIENKLKLVCLEIAQCPGGNHNSQFAMRPSNQTL